MRLSDLQQLEQDLGARRPRAVVTWLSSGRSELVAPGARLGIDALDAAIADGFRTDRSRIVALPEGEVFVHIHNPALRMVMIGAVHISQALIPMAKQAGYDVVVVDPRTAFATPERFADVTLDARWPDEALPAIGLDARTAFIALTHDPKIDDPALQLAFTSDCFYIGALGSGRTHAKRIERLMAQGQTESDLARIHAPIGLDIGAIGAPEIAISIMAQVTAVLRGRPASSKSQAR
jgi:xanthine dehydrogenase accessory factor